MSIGRRPNFLTASVLVFVLIGVWQPVGFYYDLLPNDGEAAVIPWEHDTPAAQGMSGTALQRLGTALAERGTAALLVIRNDVIVHEQYAPLQRCYRSFVAKSRAPLLYPSRPPAGQLFGTASMGKAIIGGMALTLALCDGWLGLDDPASIYIPAWREDP